MSDTPVLRRIVVGIDGSAGSIRALAYAAAVAERFGATLDVVIAYETPSPTPTGYLLDSAPPGRFAQVAYDVLDGAIADALGRRAHLVSARAALYGRAGDVLVARAAGADMLVIGGHGSRGRLSELRLGSVAEHCVKHAPCPVLVVRGGPDDSPEPVRDDSVGSTAAER